MSLPSGAKRCLPSKDHGQVFDSQVTGHPVKMNQADLMRRLKNDLADIYSDRDMDGIYVCPDDEDTRKVHALIIGPDDTPYEKGFFYFIFNYPDTYPLKPPMVKLMTTGNGTVRFNPNLYNCGKVCLSILGTWQGPGWTSVMTTKSVLISIRSLMNENPFFNEPGYEKKEKAYESESRAYNERVTHDTLRVAVIDMVTNALDPPPGGDGNSSSASGGATSSSATTSTETSLTNGTATPSSTTNESYLPFPKPSAKVVKALSTAFVIRRQGRVPYQMPQVLKEMVIRLFYKWYGHYLKLIEKNGKKDGTTSDGHRQSYFLEKGLLPSFFHSSSGYKFEYNQLKGRLDEVYKRIRMEDNLAVELYDSLRSNYCPVKTVSPEEEEEMTALFNENE